MKNVSILNEMVKEYGVRDLFESLTDNTLRENTKVIFKDQLRRLCIILGIKVKEDYYDDTVNNITRVFNDFKPIYKELFSDEHLNMISTPDGRSKHTEYVTKNILLYSVKILDEKSMFSIFLTLKEKVRSSLCRDLISNTHEFDRGDINFYSDMISMSAYFAEVLSINYLSEKFKNKISDGKLLSDFYFNDLTKDYSFEVIG